MPSRPNPGSKIRSTIAETRRVAGGVLRAYEKRDKIAETITRDLRSRGTLFKSNLGHFYFDKDSVPKLYRIQAGDIEFSSLIADRYGINRAERREYEHLIAALQTECHRRGKEVSIHRLAFYDRETGRLYVSRFDGWVYRLNGRDIRQVLNGTDDVFFWDNPGWQSYEVFRSRLRGQDGNGLLKRLIFDSANFSERNGLSVEDQRWLFSVWLRSHFFSSLLPTKPLLLSVGEMGSGKTLALRKWLKLLFGSGGEVTALEREKSDGFIAAVCAKPIVVFDNVDERVSWLPDHLAQLSTGVSFAKREYYTTNDEVTFKPDCFVGLTSRTPKFIDSREDVLDRTLIVQAERLAAFRGEEELLAEIAEHRNSLWTELLRSLNKLLRVTPTSAFRSRGGSFRMADFAGFAMAVARAEGQTEQATRVLECLETRRAELLNQSEPILLALEKWLEIPANLRRQVTSSELQAELGSIALANKLPWTSKNAHSLGQRLANLQVCLEKRFGADVARDSANQRLYCFGPKAETLKPAESQSGEIQAA